MLNEPIENDGRARTVDWPLRAGANENYFIV